MQRAKQAVGDFLHKDGKDTTTVHESVNPSITKEHVTPTRHENVTTAVDRETHQDHYHTTVQPVKDKQVLAEKHTHQTAPVEHRELHHGNSDQIKAKHVAENAQFKDTREVGETHHTKTAAPTVGGEHVHHHVHESVQPVIQRETVEPHVVHTTVPIHETHHNEAKHHTSTALPAMSMSDFKKAGGALSGRDERTDAFEGAPKGGAIGSVTGSHGHPTIGGHGASGTTHLTEKSTGTTSGIGNNTGLPASGATGASATRTAPTGGSTGVESGRTHNDGVAHSGSTGTTTTKKPSLMDKINPSKDADGDGKAGFMK